MLLDRQYLIIVIAVDFVIFAAFSFIAVVVFVGTFVVGVFLNVVFCGFI